MEGAHGWFDFGARGDVVGDIVHEGGEGDAPRVCLCSGLGCQWCEMFFCAEGDLGKEGEEESRTVWVFCLPLLLLFG